MESGSIPFIRNNSRKYFNLCLHKGSQCSLLLPLWQEEFDDLLQEFKNVGPATPIARKDQLVTQTSKWLASMEAEQVKGQAMQRVVANMAQRLRVQLSEFRRQFRSQRVVRSGQEEVDQQIGRQIARISVVLHEQGSLLQRIDADLENTQKNLRQGNRELEEKADREALNCDSLSGRVLLTLLVLDIALNLIVWIKALA